MSAETLRKAAALMRSRAQGVEEDEGGGARWKSMPTIDPNNMGWVVAYDLDADGWDTTVAQTPYDYEGHLAEHIASWHPAVALAVADWLDAEAKALEFDTGVGLTYDEAMSGMGYPALAVARAYLGETS